jgi:uncharacterized membrane protein
MNPILYAILAGLCWGLGEFCTKSVLASGQVGPMTILLVRTLLAAPPAILVYLLAMHAFKSEPVQWWRADTPVLVKLTLGSAIAAGFGGVLFFYLGLSAGQLSVVKPIAFTVGPAIATLLAWMVLKEPMNAPKALGVALVLIGIILIAGFGGHTAQHSPTTPPSTQPPSSR